MIAFLSFVYGFLLGVLMSDFFRNKALINKVESIEKSQIQLQVEFKRMREVANRMREEYE